MRHVVRAIVIKDDQVLLLWHREEGKEYYVFVGGGIDEGESDEDAIRREVMEEATITVEPARLLYRQEYFNNGEKISEQRFWHAEYVKGEPQLGHANEREKLDAGIAEYKPLWLPVSQLKNERVYPFEIRDWLLEDIQNDFSSPDLPRHSQWEEKDVPQ